MDKRNLRWGITLAIVALALLLGIKTAAAESLVYYTSGDSAATKELLARLPLSAEEAKAEPRDVATLPFPGKDGVAITGAAGVRRCDGLPISPSQLEERLNTAYAILDEDLAYADAAQAFGATWESALCATGPLSQEWCRKLWMGWGIATALQAEGDSTRLDIGRSAATDQFQTAIAMGVVTWPAEYAPTGGGYTTFLEAKLTMANRPKTVAQVNNLTAVQGMLANGSPAPPPIATPVLLQWQDAGDWRSLAVESMGSTPMLWSHGQWRELLVHGPSTEAEKALVAATFDGLPVETVVVVDLEGQKAWRWHARAAAIAFEALAPRPAADPAVQMPVVAEVKTLATKPNAQGLITLGGHLTWLDGHAYAGPVVALGGRPHPHVEIIGLGQVSLTRWEGYTFAVPGGGVEAAGAILSRTHVQLLFGGGVMVEVAQTTPTTIAPLVAGHGKLALQLREPNSPAAFRVEILVGGGNAGFRAGSRLVLALLPP